MTRQQGCHSSRRYRSFQPFMPRSEVDPQSRIPLFVAFILDVGNALSRHKPHFIGITRARTAALKPRHRIKYDSRIFYLVVKQDAPLREFPAHIAPVTSVVPQAQHLVSLLIALPHEKKSVRYVGSRETRSTIARISTRAREPMTTTAPPRNLRACLLCSILLPYNDFLKKGCPNCESLLELAGSSDAIAECTSTVYEGMIYIADPSGSWVAKWQRVEGFVSGTYATKVVGVLPDDVRSSLEASGGRVWNRAGGDIQEGF